MGGWRPITSIIITQNRLRGMETFNVLGNEISPGDALPGPSHNEIVWSLSPSPDNGPSPVSELSFSLRNLRCHDGADTPRRKLRLTPELVTPSHPGPTPSSTWGRGLAPPGEGTPTEASACEAVVPVLQRCSSEVRPRGQGSQVSRSKVTARRWSLACPSGSLLGSTMEDHTLTGDYSKPLLLPVERVDHQDLHCISAQTVASLLRGQYSGAVEHFLIIDCRYPYEYHGGHIKGADNLHTEAQIQGALLQLPALYQLSSWGRAPTSPPGQAPDTGVSGSSMGGVLQRFGSQSHSPGSGTTPPGQGSPLEGSSPRKLILYLLEGGYRYFYSCYPDLCEPRGYVPMLHSEYREQLGRFRRKTKSRLHKRPPLYKTH
ncbi:unnamed protein product [Coregonus sp. 'balchen']|nr:unnamed protein product [Coregonus sp. 'balchen']